MVIGGGVDTSKSAFLWTIQAAHLLTRGDNRRPLCFSLQFSLCCRPCFESLGSVRKKMAETRGLQGLLASQGQEWLEFRGKVCFSKSCEMSLLPVINKLYQLQNKL
jgi:hypothetical protein